MNAETKPYGNNPWPGLRAVATAPSALRAVGPAACEVGPTLRSGGIEIDMTENRASLDGAALALTDGELALLKHFLLRPNRMLTRTELLAKVWSMPGHSGSNVVDVVVCRLRRRLGARGRMIETVRGMGYRFRPWEAPTERMVGGGFSTDEGACPEVARIAR